MSIYDQFVHALYRVLVATMLSPVRNQAFQGTRKAKISATEQEALSSGSVGFEQDILSGHPHWPHLLDMPAPHLTEAETAFLEGPVQQLCDMLDDWQIRTEQHDLPPAVWAFMKHHGFFGMIIPLEYGGLGFSARAHSEVVLKLASRSTTACVTTMVPNSLGPAELLVRYGTDEQKQYYLPRLASGEEIPAFALTEPDAGSDASSMTATGVVCERNGELGILLNWHKRYITLSPVATLLGLAFKLKDPDGLLGNQPDCGITLALISTQTPGVIHGRRHNPLGVPFQNGPTAGKDVWIPISQIIGGREYAGQGWRMLMECLSVGRCISLPALSVGSSKLICRLSGAYSRVRQQFKVSISQFEGVEELLARIGGHTYLMEAARVATLQMLDRGEHPTILSAVLKYHLTECGRQIVNDGMDILGGKAICEGPGNLISPLYHAIPIGITVEGANILTRNMIIFGQGSVRSHPFLLKEIEAARLENPTEAKRRFSDLMARHVRHTVENGLRSMVYGVFQGWGSPTPHGVTQAETRYFRQINRLSASYALLADTMLMLLGDSVKRKERISALLGDTLSHLFLAACVLRHFAITGRPEADRPLMHWACQQMLHRAEDSMAQLLHNFPTQFQWMGSLLWPAIFPTGLHCKRPSHKLDRQVAQLLSQPGESRDRLTHGIYLPQTETEPLAQLERAFTLVTAAEPLQHKVRQAMREGKLTPPAHSTPAALLAMAAAEGILTPTERDTIQGAEEARQAVIQVDDFDLHWGTGDRTAPVLETTEPLAMADEKSLKASYPLGTQWAIDIPDITLVQLIESAIQRYAALPCMDSMGKKYSYQELGNLIDKAAAGLQALGVQPGMRIGLYMPNSPYYPILFFAILKVGAVVVNFCPMHTLQELREQAKDSGTRLMVTLDLKDMFEKCQRLQQEGILDHLLLCRMEDALPFLKAKAYRIFRSSQIVRPEHTTDNLTFKALIATRRPFQPVALQPHDLALLQYTGGTTGHPKGAMLTHRNLVANVLQIEEFFQASANKPDSQALLRPGKERVLAAIPYFHIFGLSVAMLASLKLGGELLLLPDPRNTQEALKTIREKKPTLFPAVPRLIQALCENPRTEGMELSRLEAVISGGAALPANVQMSFDGLTGKPGLVKQGYGLTEASPVVSSNPPYGLNKPESVGLPIPRTRIRITDPADPNRVLRLGEIGEICISGPQIMQGYYGREAESREVLQDGWLRTGDLGFLDGDYYLHIVDRQKRLIIVNGFNVYPTQIEQAMALHPAIAECIVISVPDARSGEAAKAFVRLKHGQSLTAEHLREFLSEYLSRIEIPKSIEFVKGELPKTTVGKPDWRSLQERERLSLLEFGADASLSDLIEEHAPLSRPDQEQAS